MGLKKILYGVVIVVAALTFAAPDAHACWGWGGWGGGWGYGGCGYGGWGCGGCGYGGWGGWGYSGYGWGGYRGYGSYGYAADAGPGIYGYATNDYSTRFVPAGVYTSTDRAATTTKLTLHVPAEAKVTLAGTAMKQAGEIRRYATNALPAGQAWRDYTVHVELVRDGKTLTEDRQITLTGGTAQELSIDFGGSQLAKM
jgi:uncharacterized protein (TIGR03000 family)